MSYPLIKSLHISLAMLTVVFFLWRASRSIFDPANLPRWARIAPHLIDSLLLLAGLWLMVQLGQYPFKDAWLTAKVLGLLAYIALGTLAIKRGRTKSARALATLGALLVFIYIVGVALNHSPRAWF